MEKDRHLVSRKKNLKGRRERERKTERERERERDALPRNRVTVRSKLDRGGGLRKKKKQTNKQRTNGGTSTR